MAAVETIEKLERIYGALGAVGEASTTKVADHITPDYGRFLAVAPFLALATVGPEGLDCSPRGDVPGFVRVADSRTLILPDRRGNNRIDSLRNIVRDPRVALLFMIPGVGNTLRVNGRAHISVAPGLLQSFAVEGKAPRSVAVIEVERVYFQCARALIHSETIADFLTEGLGLTSGPSARIRPPSTRSSARKARSARSATTPRRSSPTSSRSARRTTRTDARLVRARPDSITRLRRPLAGRRPDSSLPETDHGRRSPQPHRA